MSLSDILKIAAIVTFSVAAAPLLAVAIACAFVPAFRRQFVRDLSAAHRNNSRRRP